MANWHGTLNASLSLGALTANTAALASTRIDGARSQGVVIDKLKAAFFWEGKTATEGEILVGLVTGQDAAGINAWTGADPQSEEDLDEIAQEKARVYPMFVIPKAPTEIDPASYLLTLRTWGDFPGWRIREDKALNLFAWSNDANTLTTGTRVQLFCYASGRYLDD